MKHKRASKPGDLHASVGERTSRCSRLDVVLDMRGESNDADTTVISVANGQFDVFATIGLLPHGWFVLWKS